MDAPAGAEVLQGFDAALRRGLALVGQAQTVAVLNTGRTLDEFVPPLLDAARGLRDRGGSVRVLSIGAMNHEVAAELAEAGADLRFLDEERELALLVTDQAVMLNPVDLGPLDPVETCAIALTGMLPVLRFQLAFERAWARGKPALGAEGKMASARRPK